MRIGTPETGDSSTGSLPNDLLPVSDAVPSLSLLLLCDYDLVAAETVQRHIDALTKSSRHHVHRLCVAQRLPRRIALDRFDAIVLHYSVVAALDRFFDRESQNRIAAFTGLKALFIQDEHRHVQRTITILQHLGINVLFTCVPSEELEKVYPRSELPGLHKETVLTGYVAPELCRHAVPPLAERPIDVGYRARKVPAWLGRLGLEKSTIGTRFKIDAADYGLVCDISHREEDRLYRADWVAFLGRCKAVLGTESGSGVFDWTGEIEKAVTRHEVGAPDTDFDTLRELYFRDEDGRIAHGQISPRCFEAAALRCLMILYEGKYSGVLAPWRHYVPLKKDHSNMGEVVAVLRDLPHAQAIVDRAYHEVALNPDYSLVAHVARVDAVLVKLCHGRERRFGYLADEWEQIAGPNLAYRLHCLRRYVRVTLHRVFFRGLLGSLSQERRDSVQRRIRRVLRA